MNTRIAEIIKNDPGWESKPEDDKITQITEDQGLALIATQACDEMLRLRGTPATAKSLDRKLAKCVAVERVQGEECRFLKGFLSGCSLRADTASESPRRTPERGEGWWLKEWPLDLRAIAPAQPPDARTLEEKAGLTLVAFYSSIEDLLLAVLPDIKDRLGLHLPETLDRSTLDSISLTDVQVRQEEKGECSVDTPGIERKSGGVNVVRDFAYAMYECAEAQEGSESPPLCKFTRPSKKRLNQVMSKLLSELSGVQGHWEFTIRNWSK